jgi:hypothetical protein
MAIYNAILLFLVMAGLIAVAIILSIKAGSSIKVMLFGLSLTLFGGIFAADPASNLGGIEYIIAFIGLIISAVGLVKKD